MHMTTFEWKNNKTSIKRCRFSSIGSTSRLPGPGDPGCNLTRWRRVEIFSLCALDVRGLLTTREEKRVAIEFVAISGNIKS